MSLADRGPMGAARGWGIFPSPLHPVPRGLCHGPHVQTCPEIKLTPRGLTLANLQGLGLTGHGDQGQSIKTHGKGRHRRPREKKIMLERRDETMGRSSEIAGTLLSSIR